MYIISKKKDYYDGVVGSVGIDKTIIYERKTEEFTYDSKFFPEEFNRQNKNSLVRRMPKLRVKEKSKYEYIDNIIVGFCGKLYTGWIAYMEKIIDYRSEYTLTYFYDFDKIKNYIENKKFYYYNKNIEDYINYIRNYDAIEIFRKFNTPAFVYYKNRFKYSPNEGEAMFIINPILKNVEFYKVFDSVSAFQELQMFIGGVLGNNEKETINIDDKYKILEFGFNKWSFRREPTKHKK